MAQCNPRAGLRVTWPHKARQQQTNSFRTLCGLRDGGRIINMNALLQPSYSLAMTNLAHHISQEKLEIVRKTYEKAIQPWITDMKLLELKKIEQEVVIKEMTEISNSSGSEKLVLPKELVHELAWRGTEASVVHV